MPRSESPVFAVADATPWVWVGAAPALSYEVRFYGTKAGRDELPQTLGTRTVSIAVLDTWTYEGGLTEIHRSTIANAPPTLITAGQWTTLQLGLGEQRVEFAAVLAVNPSSATHYRILVKTS
jgi:hypothetical protein